MSARPQPSMQTVHHTGNHNATKPSVAEAHSADHATLMGHLFFVWRLIAIALGFLLSYGDESNGAHKSSKLTTRRSNDKFNDAEGSGFARTLEIVHSPTHGNDQLRYAVVLFDSGSDLNFVTQEWLEDNNVPYEPFLDGPRVIARSFQGAQVVALGLLKSVRFAKPNGNRSITDVAGQDINLGVRSWRADFFVLSRAKRGHDDRFHRGSSIEAIIGAKTIRQYELYRPCPLLLMSGEYPQPPVVVTAEADAEAKRRRAAEYALSLQN